MPVTEIKTSFNLVPTKEEMNQVLRKQAEDRFRSNLKKAKSLMERCADKLRQGTFQVYPVTASEEVLIMLISAYEKEGWKVEVVKKEHKSKSSKKNIYTVRHTSLQFTPPK